MQAQKSSYLSASVHLSTRTNGRPRRGGPVWVMRYRLPSGKDSRRVIGPAWTKRGRPERGYFTRVTAEAAMREFLAQHADDKPGVIMPSFDAMAAAWLEHCTRTIRPSTQRSYASIVRRELLPRWSGRAIDSITKQEIVLLHDELVERGLSPNSLNPITRRESLPLGSR